MEGLTNNEVTNFISDLQKMVLNEFHKHIDWDQTKTEQGNWPTKTFVNMWFKNETNMATKIGMLEIVKHELKKGILQLAWPNCLGKIANEPEKKGPWQTPMLYFTQASKQWEEMNPNINVRRIQISFFVGNCNSCKVHS